MGLRDKVAIVTGGNGGLGQRIGHALRDEVDRQVVEFCRTDNVTGQTLVMDSRRFFH